MRFTKIGRSTMGNSEFDNVNIGDELILHSNYGQPQIVEVMRITKTLIECDHNLKFRKKDGRSIGGGIWTFTYLALPKERELQQIRTKCFIRFVLKRVSKLDEDDISFEQALKIKEILHF